MANTVNWKVLQVAYTTAQWANITDVISKGLLCVEFATEENEEITKLKVGDGVHTFAELPYASGKAIDLSAYYTKTETEEAISTAVNAALTGVFTIKGRVDTIGDLPMENNKQGDLYLVGLADADNFVEYYWTGTAWDFCGQTVNVDLSGYYTKEEVDNLLTNKASTEEFTAHINNATIHITEEERTAWNNKISPEDDIIINCVL